MTEPSAQKIEEKLEHLRAAIRELRPFQALSRLEFDADKTTRAAIERYLQTAVEAALDAARLVIIEEQLPRPDDGEKSEFEILVDKGFLGSALGERLRAAKGFRNVLVHEYARVDPGRVYQSLQEDLGDLEEFSRVIAAYLKSVS